MRKAIHLILIVVLVAVTASCTVKEKTGRTPQPGDTLYTEAAANDVYASQPELALAIIDSAVAVGNLDENRASLLRAHFYSHNVVAPRFDTAWLICEALMESDFVKNPGAREAVLDQLVYITHRLQDYVQCLRWSTEKLNLCRQQGEETEVLRTEAEIGVILVKMGDEEKGLSKLNGVIASLDNKRRLNEMDACIIAIKRKIQVLQELEREEEVIPLAKRIVSIINDYTQNSDKYVNNSYRLTGEKEDMEDYCDFYTMQAFAYLAHAYATMGATDSARLYLSRFEASDYGQSLDGRGMIAPTWCLLGDYGKMLATFNEAEALLGIDTMSLDYIEMLRCLAIAARDMGNYRAAADYWQQYANLSNQISKKMHWGQFNQYAIHYQVKEEQLNAEREHIKAKKNRALAILGGVLLLIAICFIARLLALHRDIKRKNRVLVEQIAERIQNQQQSADTLKSVDLNTLNDEELFAFLSDVIRRERLYLDPHFERQVLMDRFSLTKERIGAAFSKGSPFASVASFVNEERLMHAARLLTELPGMSMTDVATACGFANGSAFARNFKLRFTITPTQFREERSLAKE